MAYMWDCEFKKENNYFRDNLLNWFYSFKIVVTLRVQRFFFLFNFFLFKLLFNVYYLFRHPYNNKSDILLVRKMPLSNTEEIVGVPDSALTRMSLY